MTRATRICTTEIENKKKLFQVRKWEGPVALSRFVLCTHEARKLTHFCMQSCP